jgi:segregation and condensation protein A
LKYGLDGDFETQKISFKLADFEGPLDLLLFLISKNKMSINHVPIAELVDQYIEFIRAISNADMDTQSEFLEMAARLVYIKTVSLLPVHNEAKELQSELRQELMNYNECKLLAARLRENFLGFAAFVRKPLALPAQKSGYGKTHLPFELVSAFSAAAQRISRRTPPPRENFSGIIERKVVSMASKIVYLLRRLWNGDVLGYRDIFSAASSKTELIATFLALLELCKGHRVLVENENTEDMKIYICKQT